MAETKVVSFVCHLGLQSNLWMAQSLYQAVAAIFICEAMHFNLSFADQLTIIITATLLPISAAAVPVVRD
ncbi:MAG: cation:dicarboxylase symporter family transporter [Saprospiraceae bacterium]|nr:cation:dicarboxylase symporter family transporter [Saprospiraceae bacterium]